MTPWRPVPGGLQLRLRATPRGGCDAVDGVAMLDDGQPVVKVRVRAAPENGAANEAVRRLVSETLDVSPPRVTVTAGASARVKTLAVTGDGADLAARLARVTQGGAGRSSLPLAVERGKKGTP